MVTASEARSRPLGSIETALSLSNEHWPMNLVAVLRLAPAPDTALLRAALDHLQHRHPALHARIERRRKRYDFRYDHVPAIPLEVVDASDSDAWIHAAEAGLNTGLPAASGPLLGTTLVRTAGSGDLVVSVHHAIVDAASGANLLNELLAAYVALSEGRPLPTGTLNPPPAVDSLFSSDYQGMRLQVRRAAMGLRTVGPEIRYRHSMRRAGGPSVDPAARTQVHTAELDAEATSALNRAARQRRLTLTSVLHAAILSAVHRLRYGTQSTTLRSLTFPDLRPYLDPAVPAAPLACYMASTWVDVPMKETQDLWTTAGLVQQRIEAAIRGGAKFVAATMMPPAMRTLLAAKKLRMGNAAVSYTGVTPLADRYGPLEVRGLHAFVSNLAVGPELTLRSGIFGGRLMLDAGTLDSDVDRDEMRRMAADVMANLEAAAASTR